MEPSPSGITPPEPPLLRNTSRYCSYMTGPNTVYTWTWVPSWTGEVMTISRLEIQVPSVETLGAVITRQHSHRVWTAAAFVPSPIQGFIGHEAQSNGAQRARLAISKVGLQTIRTKRLGPHSRSRTNRGFVSGHIEFLRGLTGVGHLGAGLFGFVPNYKDDCQLGAYRWA